MHRVIMNIFIIIIEQGYMSVKYKKAYDWLEEDDTDVYFNPDPTNSSSDPGPGRQADGLREGDIHQAERRVWRHQRREPVRPGSPDWQPSDPLQQDFGLTGPSCADHLQSADNE